jgi:Zn-finger nucleic acid-binding protein
MTTHFAARFPCPVCLGVQLDKTRLTGSDTALELDSCRRCGGIWFELGEVQHLRRLKPQVLWDKVALRKSAFRAPCHSCYALMDRNADVCPSCGWRNVIDCPSCDRPLHAETHDGLRLDVCRNCRGVWFDHVELAEIWRLTLNASQQRSMRGKSSVAGDVGFGVAEALAYSPHLFIYGAQTAGMGIEAGAHMLSNAPEVAVAAIEGAGDAAEGIFHAVMEIIEGIFS